jgi:FMN-dependent NADH-azoreductase
MARLLIVKAHPLDSKASYALRALEDFICLYQEEYPTDSIEEVDVFDDIPILDKDLLEAMSLAKKGQTLSPSQEKNLARYNELTEQFLRADKIVIVNPLWNLNVPSQLVSWINTINVAGRTFKYGPEGSIGLIQDKKVLHIQSNGGVYNGRDAASIYIRDIFKFLGVEDIYQVFIEGQSAEPARAEEIYQETLEQLTSLIPSF